MAGAELFVVVEGLVEGEFELGGALLGVGDGGLVAVVAVGDDELLVGHGGEDEIDEVGVGELPDGWTTPYSSVMARSAGLSSKPLGTWALRR